MFNLRQAPVAQPSTTLYRQSQHIYLMLICIQWIAFAGFTSDNPTHSQFFMRAAQPESAEVTATDHPILCSRSLLKIQRPFSARRMLRPFHSPDLVVYLRDFAPPTAMLPTTFLHPMLMLHWRPSSSKSFFGVPASTFLQKERVPSQPDLSPPQIGAQPNYPSNFPFKCIGRRI